MGTAASGLALPAQAAGVTAGSLIENTATASFDQGGTPTTVNSNTVTITVDELLDVTVAGLDGGNVPLTSAGAVLSFQVQNTGNGPEAFTLTFDAALSGDDFDPTVAELAWDSNGNGIYDAGTDAVIANGGTSPVLAADGIGRVFVVVDGSAVADGALANVRLTATAATGSGTPGTLFAGMGEGGSDAVVGAQTASAADTGTVVARSASVVLRKAASIADPFGGSEAVPGAIVTYTLTAEVTGSGSVADLVITDAIPAGTAYTPASLELDGAPLTDASGDDAGQGSASGISVDLGTVPGGAAREITFTVEIE